MNPLEEDLRQKLRDFKPQFYQQFPQEQFRAGLGLGLDLATKQIAVHLEMNQELPQNVIDAMVKSIPFGPVVVTDQTARQIVALGTPPVTGNRQDGGE